MKMALMNFFFATFMLLLSLSASALASDGEYNPHSNLQKPNLEKEKLLSTLIGIQGLVYCRSGSKLAPLEGNSPLPKFFCKVKILFIRMTSNNLPKMYNLSLKL